MLICRTCLRSIKDESAFNDAGSIVFTNQLTIRQELNWCFPELDLNLSRNVGICGDCYKALNFVCDFKHKCVQSENRIKQYISRASLSHEANLSEVIKFHAIQWNAQHIKKEIEENEANEELDVLAVDLTVTNQKENQRKIINMQTANDTQNNKACEINEHLPQILNEHNYFKNIFHYKRSDCEMNEIRGAQIYNEHNYAKY